MVTALQMNMKTLLQPTPLHFLDGPFVSSGECSPTSMALTGRKNHTSYKLLFFYVNADDIILIFFP